ncbi:sigma 54-interacting transcriptional regulator [bacterium]|nr:sigma 54-interacting transcriptional regulator [bacterium]
MSQSHPSARPHPSDAEIVNALLASVACGVLILDHELRIVRINDSASAITGVSLETARGMRCFEMLRPQGRSKRCLVDDCLTLNKAHDEQTMTILGRDDIELTVRVACRLIRDAERELLGVVVTFGDLSTVHDLRLRIDHRALFHGMVSQDHMMRSIFEVLPRMAQSNSTVLIRGETGTGKDLIARAIHDLSERSAKPFVSVNTAALPDTLLEAELFGHTKGAFTDAKADRAGRIAVAEGGTLFLDEIGDISPMMQVKLLRFLQERKYEPLGSSRSRKADVRVIAATNRNLEQMMTTGQFREDFFYRLNVLTIDLPPLRDRVNDIPLLVSHFLHALDLIEGHIPLEVSTDAMQALVAYEYPGNVRELENIIERSAILSRDRVLNLHDLPEHMRSNGNAATKTSDSDKLSNGSPVKGLTPMEQAEREAIRSMLQHNHGNKLRTAEALSISRTTLWRKLKKYSLL